MKKITLSFQLLGATIAVTILQVCAVTACAVPPPMLNPSETHHIGPGRVPVLITTATTNHLRFWIVGVSCTLEPYPPVSSTVVGVRPSAGGQKLKAWAIHGGNSSSPAVGRYYYP